MILDIVKYPDELLTKKSSQITEITDDIRLLMANMVETMLAKDGLGLAAVQVGELKHIFVLNDPDKGIRFFLNTKILESKTPIESPEGCLSFPDIKCIVSRFLEIKISYQDEQLVEHIEDLTYPMSVGVQHESDHCEGIRFIDRNAKVYDITE